MSNKLRKGWERYRSRGDEAINIVPGESLRKKSQRILNFLLTGAGIEHDEQRETLFQYLSGRPIVFKLIARFLMWKYPQKNMSHNTNLDLSKSNIKEVYEYTVAQSRLQHSTGSFRRMEIYYKLLRLPPIVPRKSKLLIIGARNVLELFIAWIYGFRWSNINAIDLFSLHPKIKIMNMEEMTYASSSFDCVSMANVYGYNDDPETCIKEISRVLKIGGRLSFNSSYIPTSDTKSGTIELDQLLRIFKKYDLRVLYHEEIPKGPNTTHIWCLEKVSYKY